MKVVQDGVDVYILPDNAYCELDKQKRSPLEMDDCPCGYEVCGGTCYYYQEDEEKREVDKE